MGIFSRKPLIVEAQQAPQVMGENLPSLYNAIALRVSRKDAMSVPSVARARNLICGTVASIPLEYYNKRTGEVMAAPRWISQLSKNQPSFITLNWLVDSLLFYGVAYLRVTERYAALRYAAVRYAMVRYRDTIHSMASDVASQWRRCGPGSGSVRRARQAVRAGRPRGPRLGTVGGHRGEARPMIIT